MLGWLPFLVLGSISLQSYLTLWALLSIIGTKIAQIIDVKYGRNFMPIGCPKTIIPNMPIKLDNAIPKINPPIIPTIVATIVLILHTPFHDLLKINAHDL